MKTIHIHDGNSIQADAGTHVSRLFHAVRIIRGQFFWGATAAGCMAALAGEKLESNPHRYSVHVNNHDWQTGFAWGIEALRRMSGRAVNIRARLHPEEYLESTDSAQGMFTAP